MEYSKMNKPCFSDSTNDSICPEDRCTNLSFPLWHKIPRFLVSCLS